MRSLLIRSIVDVSVPVKFRNLQGVSHIFLSILIIFYDLQAKLANKYHWRSKSAGMDELEPQLRNICLMFSICLHSNCLARCEGDIDSQTREMNLYGLKKLRTYRCNFLSTKRIDKPDSTILRQKLKRRYPKRNTCCAHLYTSQVHSQ